MKAAHSIHEVAGYCGFAYLPVELTSNILEFATHTTVDTNSKKPVPGTQGIISHIVCRFVCRQWSELLPCQDENMKRNFSRLVARQGWLPVLKWARENGCRMNPKTSSGAARCGQLDALKWLSEKGCRLDEYICDKAAKGGHFALLGWLQENKGCLFSPFTCEIAAGNGDLEMVQWLHEKKCPWGASTCAAAAKGGHLEVLKWLRERGCLWDCRTWEYAQLHGGELLNWVKENNCPKKPIRKGRRGCC